MYWTATSTLFEKGVPWLQVPINVTGTDEGDLSPVRFHVTGNPTALAGKLQVIEADTGPLMASSQR
jgi:hypothetical protein